MIAPVSLALVVLTLVLATIFVCTIQAKADGIAFSAAGGLVFALVDLVAALLYPRIDPATNLSVTEAVVPTLSLNLMTIVAGVLTPIVLGYFVILYLVFKGPIEPEESYDIN